MMTDEEKERMLHVGLIEGLTFALCLLLRSEAKLLYPEATKGVKL